MTHGYTNTNAEQLLNLLKEDDPAAFEALYDRYWFQLYRTAYKRLQSREEAEGAVQNLFESLWKNRHKIHVRTSLESYLFSAIRYIVLKLLYKRRIKDDPEGRATAAFLSDSSTEEAIVASDLRVQIDKVVQSLPQKCRHAFELSRYEMKTHKEIADIMGISTKTVENHITKAIHVIKRSLNAFFFL